jgi:hypothetical protein
MQVWKKKKKKISIIFEMRARLVNQTKMSGTILVDIFNFLSEK